MREYPADQPFKLGDKEYMAISHESQRCARCCFINADTCMNLVCVDYKRKDLKSVYFLPIDEYIKRRLKNEL